MTLPHITPPLVLPLFPPAVLLFHPALALPLTLKVCLYGSLTLLLSRLSS
jgi:hypothetical protein